MRYSFFKKVLSCFLLISLLLNQGLLIPVVLAQEATPSAVLEPQPSPTPDSSVTPTPTAEPSPSVAPEVTPAASPSATPTITLTPEATPTAAPDIQEPTPIAGRTASLRTPKTDKTNRPTFRDGEVIVKFHEHKIDLKKGNGEEKAESFAESQNLEVLQTLEKGNITVLETKTGESVDQLVDKLETDPRVAYAEPNYFFTPASIPSDDPYNGTLWGFENLGQIVNGISGTTDADMDIPEAWGVSEGENEIIVAVIDTGVAYSHPDLQSVMWDGSNCKNENGDFLGDCTHGFDFEDGDTDPFPTYSSHGTHVAGTIAAAKNNATGVVGVAPKVKIMALKTSFAYDETVRAIDFAIQNGAKVINASYGGSYYSQANYEAINRFRANGGIFVAAAHNYASNNDLSPLYPASFDLDNIISVAATDQNDNLAPFSNYGATSVDVGAPGVNIFSTIVNFNSDPIEILAESFNDLIAPNIPDGWTKTGNWETWDSLDSGWGNVLFADSSFPYSSNANSPITLPKFDLSDADTASVEFWASCDVRYSTGPYYDYMTLEVSSNSNFSSYSELRRWDEYDLDTDNNPNNNITPPVEYQSINVPANYLKNNTYFRFRWITDSTDNNYEGCFIDDVLITKTTPGVSYSYQAYAGTSMATPNTAGLVGLLWSYKSNLSYSQVKNLVINTGDQKDALVGKTVSGKRINAYNAMLAAQGPTITGLTTDTVPAKSKTWNWSSSDATAKFKHLISTEETVPAGGGGWLGQEFSNVTSATQPNGNGTYYLHVQAQNTSGIEGPIVTVSAVLDNTAPTLPTNLIPNPAPLTNSTVQTWTWEAATDASEIVSYIWEVVDNATSQIVAQGTTTLTSVVTNLTEGVYSFFVRSQDKAGNQSQQISSTITVDTTKPVGTITSPINGQVYSTPPPFVASAIDAQGIAMVKFQYKPTSQESFSDLNTDILSPFQAEWGNAALLSNTSYDLRVVITDRAGNSQTVSGVSFVFDTTAPTTPVITNPFQPLIINADSVFIAGTAEQGALIKVYKNNSVIKSLQLLPTQTSFAVLSIPLTQNADNVFTLSATDASGNESAKVAVPVITEDSINPSIPVYILENTTLSPGVTQGVRDTSTFVLEFSEEVTVDIDILDTQNNKVRDVYAEENITKTAGQSWNGKNNDGAYVIDGVYTLRTVITDKAGNTFTDTSKKITVDTDVISLNPIGNKLINEGSTLSFTAVAQSEEEGTFTYSLSNTPLGATFNSTTGVFNWTPSETQGPNTYSFIVSAQSSDLIKSENITVTVAEVNQAPTVVNLLASTNEDTAKTLTLIGDDSDKPENTLVYSISQNPANGTLSSINGNEVVYTPNANFNGIDTFTYQAYDGLSYSNSALATITINPINDAPVGNTQTVSVQEDSSKDVALSAIDPDNDILEYAILSNPTHGNLVLADNSQVTYTPHTNYSGNDSFIFKATDPSGLSSVGVVNLTISPVNDSPVAQNDTATTLKNNPVSIPVMQLLTNDSDVDSSTLTITMVENASNGTVSMSNATVLFTPSQNFVGIASFSYTISDGGLSDNATVTVNIEPPLELNQVIQAPQVTLDESAPQIVMSPTVFTDTTISIPKDVQNATIDVSNMSTTVGDTTSAVLSNNITINAETSVGKVTVEIPQGIEISGPSATWTGVINAPTVIDIATVDFKPADTTTTIKPSAVVEVGFGDVHLTFNKAVRMVLEGQAGKSAGYSRGTLFAPITTICSEDSQTAGNELPDGADCRIDVQGDMVIWTKHFTKFVAYTQTSNIASSSTSSSTTNLTCTDTKPASAPKLLSVSSGKNSATLTWDKAANPVSYYVVSYGTAPGFQQYATPHINGNSTTSYTINGLSGGTRYYFKVRAGNGCTPGEYSNELSTEAEGIFIATTSDDYISNTFDIQEKTTIIEDVKGALVQRITRAQQAPSAIDQLRSLGMVGFLIMMMLPFLVISNYAMYRARFKRS